jgi:hypothetical protein
MIAAGSSLLVLPLMLGLGGAAIITSIAAGALAVALGAAGTASEGRGTIPLSAQAVYDRLLALGLLIAAVLFGLAGEGAALAFFGAAGVVALAVATATRYSAAPKELSP